MSNLEPSAASLAELLPAEAQQGGPANMVSHPPQATAEHPLPAAASEFRMPQVASRPQADDTCVHLAAVGLKKSYRKSQIEIPVLRGLDLVIERGEFVSIIGQSGSGKSTLLHLLATLDAPDEGQIFFQGNRIDDLAGAGRDVLRNKYFGMIFQFYHLLPELTTLENVLSPMMISSGMFKYFANRKKYVQAATDLLEQVGLGHRLKHKPRELSGGEMQRAAIARALITNPELLLADEPTGNLDRATGTDIMRLLRSLNEQHKLTIVMVTHDAAIAEQADRVIRLAEGLVVDA